jgi:hypothetical protein
LPVVSVIAGVAVPESIRLCTSCHVHVVGRNGTAATAGGPAPRDDDRSVLACAQRIGRANVDTDNFAQVRPHGQPRRVAGACCRAAWLVLAAAPRRTAWRAPCSTAVQRRPGELSDGEPLFAAYAAYREIQQQIGELTDGCVLSRGAKPAALRRVRGGCARRIGPKRRNGIARKTDGLMTQQAAGSCCCVMTVDCNGEGDCYLPTYLPTYLLTMGCRPQCVG